jgi:hypothetical protein
MDKLNPQAANLKGIHFGVFLMITTIQNLVFRRQACC